MWVLQSRENKGITFRFASKPVMSKTNDFEEIVSLHLAYIGVIMADQIIA